MTPFETEWLEVILDLKTQCATHPSTTASSINFHRADVLLEKMRDPDAPTPPLPTHCPNGHELGPGTTSHNPRAGWTAQCGICGALITQQMIEHTRT